MANKLQMSGLVSATALFLAAALTGCGGSSGESGASGSGGGSSVAGSGSTTATLVWESPTTNVDQTCLTDLSAFEVSYGTASRAYSSVQSLSVNAASCTNTGTEPVPGCGSTQSCTYTVQGVPRGTLYFAVRALDSSGNASSYSNEIAFVN